MALDNSIIDVNLNKFAEEISEDKISFLDTIVYKGEQFKSMSILDVGTHLKPTETFQ